MSHCLAQFRGLTLALIQERVCAHYNLSVRSLVDETRRRDIARPRQVGMYLARQLTRCSYPQIAHKFGKTDHTTAIWAVRRIEQLRLTDPEVDNAVRFIAAELQLRTTYPQSSENQGGSKLVNQPRGEG